MSHVCQYLSQKFLSQGFIHANKASGSHPWNIATDLSNDDDDDHVAEAICRRCPNMHRASRDS